MDASTGDDREARRRERLEAVGDNENVIIIKSIEPQVTYADILKAVREFIIAHSQTNQVESEQGEASNYKAAVLEKGPDDSLLIFTMGYMDPQKFIDDFQKENELPLTLQINLCQDTEVALLGEMTQEQPAQVPCAAASSCDPV